MLKSRNFRIAIIATFVAVVLIAFFVFAEPIHSAGENELHSIVAQYFGDYSNVVRFDLGIAFANTLLLVFPIAIPFTLFDLFFMREPPVEHLGIFACLLVAVVLNIMVSVALYVLSGGWAPPAIAPLIALILAWFLVVAIVSEIRILRQITKRNGSNAG